MTKITKTLIDSTAAPAKGDVWLWDSELPGFGVRVQASGRKTYVVRYRTRDSKRTQRKITLCRCTDAAPEKARAMARDVFTRVAVGEDPAQERKPETKGGITIVDMFEARVAAMRERGRANAGENERVLLKSKHNFADFIGRDKHPSEITPDDVIRFVAVHYKAGHRGAADKARGYLAATFEWAIKSANDYTVSHRRDWGVTTNPASAVAKDHGAIGVRDRNLSAEEVRALWLACENGNGGFSREIEVCIRLIIAAGQRVQETLRLEGSEIDLEKRMWIMPAHKTKGGKTIHRIPLPDIIIPDLTDLVAKHGDGYLFPARTGSKSPTIDPNSVLQAIKRWLAEDDDFEAFQTRDLRRTWKSRTHDAGIDRFTRDLIQQHAQSTDTGSKHYDRADYMPQMRDAMDKWSEWLQAVVDGNTPSSNVVQLVA